MKNRPEDMFDHVDDHLEEIAMDYWRQDSSGELSDIGQFVMDNPRLFTAFVEEWAKLPDNADKVRRWFERTEEREAEPEDMAGSDR